MAKIRPKIGEHWTLRSGIGEADIIVTHVQVQSTFDAGPKVYIEGLVEEQRMGMTETYGTSSITANNVSSGTFTGIHFAQYNDFPGGPHSNPNRSMHKDQHTSKTDIKGMAVDIKIVDTVEGTVAQLVVSLSGKNTIVWQSQPFEDQVDGDKVTTADVLARKDAEAHAKSVLKTLFSQS